MRRKRFHAEALAHPNVPRIALDDAYPTRAGLIEEIVRVPFDTVRHSVGRVAVDTQVFVSRR